MILSCFLASEKVSSSINIFVFCSWDIDMDFLFSFLSPLELVKKLCMLYYSPYKRPCRVNQDSLKMEEKSFGADHSLLLIPEDLYLLDG